ATGGALASNSFTFTAGGVNGGTLVLTLLLQDGATALPPVSITNSLPATNTFANTGSIIIPDHGAANPYPSTITVSNMPGLVTKVTVTLSNMNHSFPDDIDILLVSPSGEHTLLMSDAGGAHAITNVTLGFDDAGAGLLPDSTQIVSGTFQPTDYNTT